MRIVWAIETKDDFRRLDEFLSPVDQNAARRAADTIRKQAQILIDHPQAGTLLDEDTGRRELFIRFGQRGYVLRYIPDYAAGEIRIIRVWHSREDRPG